MQHERDRKHLPACASSTLVEIHSGGRTACSNTARPTTRKRNVRACGTEQGFDYGEHVNTSAGCALNSFIYTQIAMLLALARHRGWDLNTSLTTVQYTTTACCKDDSNTTDDSGHRHGAGHGRGPTTPLKEDAQVRCVTEHATVARHVWKKRETSIGSRSADTSLE